MATACVGEAMLTDIAGAIAVSDRESESEGPSFETLVEAASVGGLFHFWAPLNRAATGAYLEDGSNSAAKAKRPRT
jgi:hypothetical protein